ncbi:MAG: polysaccharide pyruvyl transferase family protein [Lachnospiraceae bacterium]
MTVNTVSQFACTGCGACKNICPVDAITMCLDEAGFYKPVIDEKCVDCGKCVATCPVLHPVHDNYKKPRSFAYMASDEERMRSSSGGAFAMLAEFVLEQDGYVCGAVFSEDLREVHHVVSKEREVFEAMRGSKYLQSDTRDCFSEIKKLLKEDQYVLFSGCPCQVAGLKSFLGASYEKLLTADLICHGVPSVKVWRKFQDAVSGDKTMTRFTFRDNSVPKAWHASTYTATFSDGSTVRPTSDTYFYKRGFLRGISVNESCGSCEFSKIPRQGDVTIGDFWGIEAAYNDEKGTSVLVANTPKGLEAVTRLSDRGDCKLSKEFPLEAAKKRNPALSRSLHLNRNHRRFFMKLDTLPYAKLVADCLANEYDIGIVGVWYGLNFGSVLTYFALAKLYEANGKSVLFLEKPKELWGDEFYDPETIANKFIRSRFPVSNRHDNYPTWKGMNNICRSFIVGSDVVWNQQVCHCHHHFFLDFVSRRRARISFASSFGTRYRAEPEFTEQAGKYLKEFDFVSVRESVGADICREQLGVTAEKVLDPVFLVDRNIFLEEAHKSTLTDKNFIASYFLLKYKEIPEILQMASSHFNLPVKPILAANPLDKDRQPMYDMLTEEGYECTFDIGIEDFLYHFSECEFFVGNSFHGLCFSLIFQKNFVILRPKNNPNSNRVLDLTKSLGIPERIVIFDGTDSWKDKVQTLLETPVDYESINARLAERVQSSNDFVSRTLEFMDAREVFSQTELIPHLKVLQKVKEKFIIGIAVKDIVGHHVSLYQDALHALGLQADYVNNNGWNGYTALISHGEVLHEKMAGIGEDSEVTRELSENLTVKLLSSPCNSQNVASILVNEVEHAVNRRGFNIVVIDPVTNLIVSSASFDTHIDPKEAPAMNGQDGASIHSTSLFSKGLQSIRRDGIGGTWEKVKNYLKK